MSPGFFSGNRWFRVGAIVGIFLMAASCRASAAEGGTQNEGGAPEPGYAQTGVLRAVFIASNPVQAIADPKTGKVSGPAAEIAQELARRLRVPLRIAGAPGAAGVIETMKKGEADIGFLAFDPARAAELDFSRTYALAQNTYAVLERSPLRSVADVDRAGVRVGVATRDAGDLFLTRALKQATLTRNPGGDLDKAMQMLRSGEIDAYAANRQRLSELAARVPDLRLFPDNFYGVEQAIVVAKGQRALLEEVNHVLEGMRTSGRLAAAIERAGLKGVDVAP
jgi:polar amino acid transport system substrate-binding protein